MAFFKINQHINIAIQSEIGTSDRSEKRELPYMVSTAKSRNLVFGDINIHNDWPSRKHFHYIDTSMADYFSKDCVFRTQGVFWRA
jgi:hypothetical protein